MQVIHVWLSSWSQTAETAAAQLLLSGLDGVVVESQADGQCSSQHCLCCAGMSRWPERGLQTPRHQATCGIESLPAALTICQHLYMQKMIVTRTNESCIARSLLDQLLARHELADAESPKQTAMHIHVMHGEA